MNFKHTHVFHFFRFLHVSCLAFMHCYLLLLLFITTQFNVVFYVSISSFHSNILFQKLISMNEFVFSLFYSNSYLYHSRIFFFDICLLYTLSFLILYFFLNENRYFCCHLMCIKCKYII